MHYYFSQLFKGDTVQLTLLRDGQTMEASVPVYIHKLAVAPHLNNGMPSYLMVHILTQGVGIDVLTPGYAVLYSTNPSVKIQRPHTHIHRWAAWSSRC